MLLLGLASKGCVGVNGSAIVITGSVPLVSESAPIPPTGVNTDDDDGVGERDGSPGLYSSACTKDNAPLLLPGWTIDSNPKETTTRRPRLMLLFATRMRILII